MRLAVPLAIAVVILAAMAAGGPRSVVAASSQQRPDATEHVPPTDGSPADLDSLLLAIPPDPAAIRAAFISRFDTWQDAWRTSADYFDKLAPVHSERLMALAMEVANDETLKPEVRTTPLRS